MRQVIFDFDYIHSLKDFYSEAFNELVLPAYFGYNQDALWDCIMGDIELPVEISFINMTLIQIKEFAGLIKLFQDAENELVEEVFFDYSLKNAIDEDSAEIEI
jgi:ribonuclease inhibitor